MQHCRAADASVIQAVTPSEMFNWPGPDRPLNWPSERTGRENNWYSLTGRVVAVKVEPDGDVHLALKMRPATLGIVVCEMPARPQWCEIRRAVFVGRECAFLRAFNPRKNSRSI
jgi:hypothetical protein